MYWEHSLRNKQTLQIICLAILMQNTLLCQDNEWKNKYHSSGRKKDFAGQKLSWRQL